MAGGPTTVDLVVSAAQAGALGFLAGGYKTAQAIGQDIDAVRAATDRAFGINLFVPGQPTRYPDDLAQYVRTLEGEADAQATVVGDPVWDDDDYTEKLEVVLDRRPALVSFTFGCPSRDIVGALQSEGVLVAVTVTTPDEASSARDAGVDCLCLQGSEAGGHRGSFANDDRPRQDYPLETLLDDVRGRTDIPLIAAGGLHSPDAVAAALAAGASMVQVGTAFLRCAESGAHPVYKDALADPRFTATVITRAFSGRRARALRNDFILAHDGAPAAYPEINNATRPMRAAAAAKGEPDRMSLYAGEGFAAAEARPASEIIEQLLAAVRSTA
jgi:nitronate monooxygenase